MELIFIARRGVARRAIHLGPGAVLLLALTVLSMVGGAFWLGIQRSQQHVQVAMSADDPRPDLVAAAMASELAQLREDVVMAKDRAEHDLDALAQQMSELQARAIRVDALGARLVDMVGLAPEEFSFGSVPPMGGPAPADSDADSGADSGAQTQASDLASALDALATRLAGRVHELEVLEKALLEARMAEQMHPAGRPVSIGWVSSGFGWRRDPMTGRRSFHEGIDFPGRPGSPIFAVASGIVTFAGVRGGFGNVVEIDHGRGYVTRYAHNKKNLVKRGGRVAKGQKIATMGRSGRVTGTHLHFEVLKDGKPLNPMTFIRQEQARKAAKPESSSGS